MATKWIDKTLLENWSPTFVIFQFFFHVLAEIFTFLTAIISMFVSIKIKNIEGQYTSTTSLDLKESKAMVRLQR